MTWWQWAICGIAAAIALLRLGYKIGGADYDRLRAYAAHLQVELSAAEQNIARFAQDNLTTADQQRSPVGFWMPEGLAAQQRANREAN